MIYDFIESGLARFKTGLHDNQADHDEILNSCRKVNELLNGVSPIEKYEDYIAKNLIEILPMFEIFFWQICSKYKCPNLWPILRRLSNFQQRLVIHRPSYRDHVLHSVQNVLLGFACIGHKANFVDNKFSMPTLFISLAYHDLGYIEQIISPEKFGQGAIPQLEAYFYDALKDQTGNTNGMGQDEQLEMLQNVLCLDQKILSLLSRSNVLSEIADKIWAKDYQKQNQQIGQFLNQIGLPDFPLGEYGKWKAREHVPIPVQYQHSLASAMLLFKIVSTRDYIVRHHLSDITLGDPYEQIFFGANVFGALKAVFLHDFDLAECPFTQEISRSLQPREIFVIVIDELQTYGRPSFNIEFPYPSLNPKLAGYQIDDNNKLQPVIAKNLQGETTDPHRPSYYHTTKEIESSLKKKIGDRALEYLATEEFR